MGVVMRFAVGFGSAVTVSLVALALSQVSPTARTTQTATTAGVPNMAGQILTVAGPMDPEDLGQTIMHEHIFIDLTVMDGDQFAALPVLMLLGVSLGVFWPLPPLQMNIS